MSTTVSKAWLEGEAAGKSPVPVSGSPYRPYSVECYDWWKGFHATTDKSHNQPYDFKSGQPMTQKQFETGMDAITPVEPVWKSASGQLYRNLRSGKDRRDPTKFTSGDAHGNPRRMAEKDRRASPIANPIASQPKKSDTTADKPKASARQEGGDHYTKLAIQPMAYSMANKLDPLQHSVVKYITRFRDKNGLVDLRKAIHCIELLIEHETKKEAQ